MPKGSYQPILLLNNMKKKNLYLLPFFDKVENNDFQQNSNIYPKKLFFLNFSFQKRCVRL